MILLCGVPSEPPLKLAIEAAEAAGIDHLVINQRHAHLWDLRLVSGGTGLGGTLVVAGTEHDLDAVAGVYHRMTAEDDLPEVTGYGRRAADPHVAARVRAFHSLFGAWIEGTTCRVANRPSAGGSNLSKPYQAQLIAAAGLAVPDTLISNDPRVVSRYLAVNDEVVFKSISSVRSIVRKVDAGRVAQLERVRSLPTQFQRRVSGTDVRVHVVGEVVFATEIASEAVDYRYAGRDGQDAGFRAVELPEAVVAACLRLAAVLELPFCGIDLRRTPEGSYVCFEVNPSPGYSYYQSLTGQPIAAALVAWLAEGTAATAGGRPPS